MPLLLSVTSIVDGRFPVLPIFVKSSSELRESISYPSSSVPLAPLSTMDISGLRLADPGLLESFSFRRVARPYMLTDLRSEGSLGSRDWTAEGSIEYSIEDSLVRGEAKSADKRRGRCRGTAIGMQ
jgi:hypothetical protein